MELPHRHLINLDTQAILQRGTFAKYHVYGQDIFQCHIFRHQAALEYTTSWHGGTHVYWSLPHKSKAKNRPPRSTQTVGPMMSGECQKLKARCNFRQRSPVKWRGALSLVTYLYKANIWFESRFLTCLDIWHKKLTQTQHYFVHLSQISQDGTKLKSPMISGQRVDGQSMGSYPQYPGFNSLFATK
jgi:hypothetical protein